VRNFCSPPTFQHLRTPIQTQTSHEQTNFVASTLAKQREKNSRTVLQYRQFLYKMNTATSGRLYHCENKLFSGSVVYLVCILMFTETVLKPLKNTFYNERFVQAIKSLMQINAGSYL
jgi:hypothetical protein